MTIKSDSYWVCARTEPHREAFAEAQLVHAGLEVYCPRYARWISSGRKKSLVKRPLFASYLFVRTDENPEKIWQIKRLPGIASLASKTISSAIVDDRVIDEIRSRDKEGVVVLGSGGRRIIKNELADHGLVGRPQLARPRERLAVKARGHEARSDAERCRILLSLLGGMQSVLISAELLEKI